MYFPLAASNVFLTAYSQSDFFGKLIFLGLFFLSLICWIVLVHKAWMTRNVKKVSVAFQAAIDQNRSPIFSLDLGHLPQPAKRSLPHPFAQIFTDLRSKAVEILNKNRFFASKDGNNSPAVHLSSQDLELIESHTLTTISAQGKILERNLFILSTVVTLGPFLGLLGTVWGILISFGEMHTGGTASSNAAVIGGLSTALATTVLGLLIAIPALIAYNYLKHSLRDLSSDMEDFLYRLLAQVELQYRPPT